jgi:hypothetical protein
MPMAIYQGLNATRNNMVHLLRIYYHPPQNFDLLMKNVWHGTTFWHLEWLSQPREEREIDKIASLNSSKAVAITWALAILGRPMWQLESGQWCEELLERYPELGFRGAMYGMLDAAWSSSSLSSSGSCLLLADSSRHTRVEVRWSGLSWSWSRAMVVSRFVTRSWSHVLHLLTIW